MKKIILYFFALILIYCCSDKTSKDATLDCLLDKVKEKDTLYVNFQFNGCMISGREQIKIFKKDNLFYLKYIKQKYDDNIDSLEVFHAILNNSSIMAYKKMEAEARKFESSCCSTDHRNTDIILQNDTIKFVDYGADEGFIYYHLFLKTLPLPQAALLPKGSTYAYEK